MAYKTMKAETIYQIYRRHQNGQSKLAIARSLGLDPKTVRVYLNLLAGANIAATQDQGYSHVLQKCAALIPSRKTKQSEQDKLLPFKEEIRLLVNNKAEPVKPKTAYQIICKRHKLSVSYEAFKRFYRREYSGKIKPEIIYRIERPPAEECQLDYGKVGMLYDPVLKRNRAVWAYTGILSYSRLPFVQFVYSQNQESFISSTIDMFNYYGGVPKYLTIDNLKSGVIKPDLYEPQLNKAFEEMAVYYKTFINPCRIRTPKDKGKVERFIPVARELFRLLKHTNANASLKELNNQALTWTKDTYGNRKHGTTGQHPVDVFNLIEQPKMGSLPEQAFDIPLWKQVAVHPDQFIQFDKKRYSVPAKYRGLQLWAKRCRNILYIFDNYELIRQHTITAKKVSYLEGDFPDDKSKMLKSSYPNYLIREANQICEEAGQYMEDTLKPHAFINLRRAMGLLKTIKENKKHPKLSEVCAKARRLKIVHPKKLQYIMEAEQAQGELNIPVSFEGQSMIRDAAYYIQ